MKNSEDDIAFTCKSSSDDISKRTEAGDSSSKYFHYVSSTVCSSSFSFLIHFFFVLISVITWNKNDWFCSNWYSGSMMIDQLVVLVSKSISLKFIYLRKNEIKKNNKRKKIK